jgi:hypothetical protein
VNPRPPFADELTREQELAAFERLKPRLHQVWDVISAQEDLPATSIVVPSQVPRVAAAGVTAAAMTIKHAISRLASFGNLMKSPGNVERSIVPSLTSDIRRQRIQLWSVSSCFDSDPATPPLGSRGNVRL